MNRHERRKMKATTKAEYYRACSALVDAVMVWGRRTQLVPRFRMPPIDDHVVVPLTKIVDRIALDDAARDLVAEVCRPPVAKEPTLFMLDVALGVCGVPVERVSLAELGIEMPQRMNPHNSLVALDPPRRHPARRWKCHYCGVEGLLETVRAIACTYVYPPCEHCGETPTCAADCPGIAAALSDGGVYLAGIVGGDRSES